MIAARIRDEVHYGGTKIVPVTSSLIDLDYVVLCRSGLVDDLAWHVNKRAVLLWEALEDAS